MRYHVAAFFIGIIIDSIVGDPQGLPHPIRLIGKLIFALEKLLYPRENLASDDNISKKSRRVRGTILVIFVVVITGLVTAGILYFFYRLGIISGIIAEAVLTSYTLAAKDLKIESMRVYDTLIKGSIKEAQTAVGMIVGRDTSVLNRKGIIKATVETIAENTSDGVIAPLLYDALLGPVGGMVYKSINTMDSMIGYKNDRYIDFGRSAAKTDDLINLLPARITAMLMLAATFFLERFSKFFSYKTAKKIYFRDKRTGESPNALQSESVMAGALRIALGGDAVYFGKTVKKPVIGDDIRPPEPEDIVRANRLTLLSYILGIILCMTILMTFLLSTEGIFIPGI